MLGRGQSDHYQALPSGHPGITGATKVLIDLLLSWYQAAARGSSFDYRRRRSLTNIGPSLLKNLRYPDITYVAMLIEGSGLTLLGAWLAQCCDSECKSSWQIAK